MPVQEACRSELADPARGASGTGTWHCAHWQACSSESSLSGPAARRLVRPLRTTQACGDRNHWRSRGYGEEAQGQTGEAEASCLGQPARASESVSGAAGAPGGTAVGCALRPALVPGADSADDGIMIMRMMATDAPREAPKPETEEAGQGDWR
jgi:hypothetical protein